MAYDPANAAPYAAAFGSDMQAMQKGFAQKKAGADYKTQMGGGAAVAGAAMGALGEVIGSIDKFKGGKGSKAEGTQIAQRKKKAQGALDIAAAGAGMAGPVGMAVAAPLKLISMLLNIKGPRQKRRERAAAHRRRVDSRHSSMRSNAISAGLQGAGGALRTGATAMGAPPTVADPTPETVSFTPQVTNDR